LNLPKPMPGDVPGNTNCRTHLAPFVTGDGEVDVGQEAYKCRILLSRHATPSVKLRNDSMNCRRVHLSASYIHKFFVGGVVP